MLAAGTSERFGGEPKLLAELAGRPIVRRATDAARGSGLAPVVVVVGPGGLGRAVADAVGTDVDIVVNPEPTRGIASSLGAALDALEDRTDVDAVVVGLGDQPLVGVDAYRRLAAAHDQTAPLVVATYGGRRGNPVLVDRSLWSEARVLSGDAGARALMRDHPVHEVACDGTGSPDDVDRPGDLEALETRCASTTNSE